MPPWVRVAEHSTPPSLLERRGLSPSKQPLPGCSYITAVTPVIAQHIANGMYGLILVEPPGGLPPVSHEFYVMQGEVYTTGAMGGAGMQKMSVSRLLDERPNYVVFNGAVGALAGQHALRSAVGDTIRIFFGVAGPNLTASFHIVGEIFSKVYGLGSFDSSPLKKCADSLCTPRGSGSHRVEHPCPRAVHVDGPRDESRDEGLHGIPRGHRSSSTAVDARRTRRSGVAR